MTFAPTANGAWDGTGAIVGGASAGPALDLCSVAARAASSKLAQETIVLDMGSLIGLTDAFVITSGTNARQVRSIADEVERQLKLAGAGGPISVEGLDDARWVLMDYGNVIVHVFLDEARQFYDLEDLWGDAQQWEWDDAESTLVTAAP